MSTRRPAVAPAAPDETLLGLAADTSLRDDPRLLHDPRRLGSLHAQLVDSLGPADAAAALLQAGFLRGLRDARQVDRATREAWGGADTAARASALQLGIALVPHPQGELEGCWRDGHEAEGRVARLGPAESPCCWVSAGYTSGWLTGLLDEDLLAVETECASCGAPRCRFRVRSPDAWRAAGDPRAAALLERLDVPRLRAVVSCEEPAGPGDEQLDPDAAAVHVWGPVMVLPFGGADESLAALELIGRDESARDVSVVVVDLAGTVLDEGWGAVALERVLEAVAGWGAEAVLTGVSPLSMPVVARLEARHLLVHKDLPEAIAAAFQIADAQRRVY